MEYNLWTSCPQLPPASFWRARLARPIYGSYCWCCPLLIIVTTMTKLQNGSEIQMCQVVKIHTRHYGC